MVTPKPRYERIGRTYSATRRTDPGIAAQLWDALGDARSVVNVGAGAGSYEPPGLEVIPIEPSQTMAAQRPPELARAIVASAEELPLPDDVADAAMAVITIHHWHDIPRGIAEMRRVARERVLILTLDGAVTRHNWLREYAPRLAELDEELPDVAWLAELMGGAESRPVLVGRDCEDLFLESTFSRPELVLDPVFRANTSGFARMDDEAEAEAAERIRRDLESGEWDRRYGHLREQETFDGGLRLLIGTASG